MSTPPLADVQIECLDGKPFNTKVTIDGVQIYPTKIVWTADPAGSVTRAELEVPRVGILAKQTEVIARYVAHKSSFPWFWWKCPCGMEMACQTPEQAGATFQDPASHIAGCDVLTAQPDESEVAGER